MTTTPSPDPVTRVLLVEDYMPHVEVVRLFLEQAVNTRFALTHVEWLSHAFRELAAGQFDIVLLDLDLPDSQGLPTLVAFRARVPNIPVVVLTAHDEDELAVSALREGAQDFVVKWQRRGPKLLRAMRFAIVRAQLWHAPPQPGQPINILLVDDSAGDVRLLHESLRECKLRNPLYVLSDGDAALAFLRREGKFSTAPRPTLILLDWYLPTKSGGEVLAEIKRDPALADIPVIVLTTSQLEAERLAAFQPHAVGYLTKPFDIEQLIKLVNARDEFWLSIVTQPAH
ncbi:MAG: response regulator [Deltaproteobacteria bacterium]|nr:response regulator [Deltaproteobacteria bacterium]